MEQRDPTDLDALRAASDVLGIDALLTDAEKAVGDRLRAFVDAEVRPHIAEWFDRASFPVEIVREFGRLGVLGMSLDGYGCPGGTAVEYGLAALEIEAGDSGLRTFVSVQGSLVMGSIHRWGSEEQKQEWLPRLAAGEAIGSFALTEPSAGSDPASMTTSARRDGDDWILSGEKRWIGLATIAQVATATRPPCAGRSRASSSAAGLPGSSSRSANSSTWRPNCRRARCSRCTSDG